MGTRTDWTRTATSPPGSQRAPREGPPLQGAAALPLVDPARYEVLGEFTRAFALGDVLLRRLLATGKMSFEVAPLG